MQKFENKKEYESWINSQEWYQTIQLKDGLATPGRWPTDERTSFFSKFDFAGKRVIDIGCNSGQYALLAKQLGASEVVGIDVLRDRIEQGKTLALNEDLPVTFETRGIFDLTEQDGRFDIVICIAVVTEIADFFGAIDKIKQVTGDVAIIELDLAKPKLYLSTSKNWLRGNKHVSRQKSVAEVRYSKAGGWVISPSFQVLQAAFGDEFTVEKLGTGVRYDLVKITRKK